MIILKLATNGLDLIKLETNLVTSDNKKSVSLEVTFDDSWTGYGKSATFKSSSSDKIYEVPLADNSCVVPWEVLESVGTMSVGVRGVKDDGSVIASDLVDYKIAQGAKTGDGTSEDPTPTVYEQLLSNYGSVDRKINKEIQDRKDAIANEKTERTSAIGNAIASEKSERVSADNSEATARANADESLRKAIDALVSPSGQSVVIDSSLSISGAGADAKVTGDIFAKLRSTKSDVDLSYWTEGHYALITNGNIGNNSEYSLTMKSVSSVRGNCPSILPSTMYTIRHIGRLLVCLYDSSYSFVRGVEYKASDDTTILTETINTDDNVAYVVFSCKTINKSALGVYNGSYNEKNVINADTTVIPVSAVDGYQPTVFEVGNGKEFTTLQSAFNRCSNPSKNNRYIVKYYGNGEEYDVSKELNSSNSTYGLFVPPYTKLIGVGGKEKNILALRLTEASQELSTINLYNSSELEGFTIIGKNTRYPVHDDWYADIEEITRTVKNCHFISEGVRYWRSYGSGFRSGCNWIFENCIFEGKNGDYAFSSHNNINFTNYGSITFDNCVFISTMNTQSVVFTSLGTSDDCINPLIFKGCSIGKLLFEESSGYKGMKFSVSGYGNDIKTGDENISINVTDGGTYSDRISLR